MLARLLQTTCALVLMVMLGLGMAFRSHFPDGRGFWIGCSVPALTFGVLLAVQMAVARVLNRADPSPAAGRRGLPAVWAIECWHAAFAFCWRQPFRTAQLPDYFPANTKRGVVFLHGFVCNRGLWLAWLALLRQHGHTYVALNMEPVFGSIDRLVPQIDAAVGEVTRATGLPPVLVCHSMGGLAARAWLASIGDSSRVAHVVTIGTPHSGTWWARFGFVANNRQMRRHSQWLEALAATENMALRRKFTCWYSSADQIVIPASTATLAGADNRHVPGRAHMALAFAPAVVAGTLALIQYPCNESAVK